MISAREVEAAQFRAAGVGQVGYDEAAVDGFLDRAVKTLRAIEAGETLPQDAITSSDVVEATFPELPGDSAAGYNLDDVDDLLDAVALRLFKSERNRGQARAQLTDRNGQSDAGRETFAQDAGQVGYTEAAAPELNDEPHRVDGDGQDVALRDERDEAARCDSERTSLNADNVNADVASEPIDGAAGDNKRANEAVLPGQTMLNIDDSRDAAPTQSRTRNGEQPVWNGWEDPSAPAPSAQPVQQDDAPKNEARKGSSAYAAPTQSVWNGWEDPSAPEMNEADDAPQGVVSSSDETSEASAGSQSSAGQTAAAETPSQATSHSDSRVADVVGAAGFGIAGVAAGHAVSERHERSETKTDARATQTSEGVTASSSQDVSSANSDGVSAPSQAATAPATNSAKSASGINPVGGDPVAEGPIESTSSPQPSGGPINPVGADAESDEAQTSRPASSAARSEVSDNSMPSVAREDSSNVSTTTDARPVADEDARKDDAPRSSNHVVEAGVAGGAVAGAAGLAHHESTKKDAEPRQTIVSEPATRDVSANTDGVEGSAAARDTSTAGVQDAEPYETGKVASAQTAETSRDAENSSARNDEFAGINPVGGDPLEESVARGHSAPVSGGAKTETNHSGVAAAGAAGAVGAGAAIVSSHQFDRTASGENAQPAEIRPTTDGAVREQPPVASQSDSAAAVPAEGKPADSRVTNDITSERGEASAENEKAVAPQPEDRAAAEPAVTPAESQTASAEDARPVTLSDSSSSDSATDDKVDAPVSRRRDRAGAVAGVAGLGAAGAVYEHERSEKQESAPSPASDGVTTTSNEANAAAPREEFTADEPAQVVEATSSVSEDAETATPSSDERLVYVNREGFGEERTVSAPAAKENVASQGNESAAAPVTAEVSETIIVTDAPGTPGEVGWIAPTAADHYGVRGSDVKNSEATRSEASAKDAQSLEGSAESAPSAPKKDDAGADDESKAPSVSASEKVAAAAAGTAAVTAVAAHKASSSGERAADVAPAKKDDVQSSATAPGSQAADAASLTDSEQVPASVEPQTADSVRMPNSAVVMPAPTQAQASVPTNPGSEDEVNFHPEYSEYVPGAVTGANSAGSADNAEDAKGESVAETNAASSGGQTSSAPYVKRPVAGTQPEIDRGPDAGVLPLSLTNEENTVSNSEQASSIGSPEPIDAPSSIDGPEQVKQATSVPKREENEGALGFVRRLLKRS